MTANCPNMNKAGCGLIVKASCSVDMRSCLPLLKARCTCFPKGYPTMTHGNGMSCRNQIGREINDAIGKGLSIHDLHEHCKQTAQPKWDSNLKETRGKRYMAKPVRKFLRLSRPYLNTTAEISHEGLICGTLPHLNSIPRILTRMASAS